MTKACMRKGAFNKGPAAGRGRVSSACSRAGVWCAQGRWGAWRLNGQQANRCQRAAPIWAGCVKVRVRSTWMAAGIDMHACIGHVTVKGGAAGGHEAIGRGGAAPAGAGVWGPALLAGKRGRAPPVRPGAKANRGGMHPRQQWAAMQQASSSRIAWLWGRHGAQPGVQEEGLQCLGPCSGLKGVDPLCGLMLLFGRRRLRARRAPQVEGRESRRAVAVAAVVFQRDPEHAAGAPVGGGRLRSRARAQARGRGGSDKHGHRSGGKWLRHCSCHEGPSLITVQFQLTVITRRARLQAHSPIWRRTACRRGCTS